MSPQIIYEILPPVVGRDYCMALIDKQLDDDQQQQNEHGHGDDDGGKRQRFVYTI